MASNVDKRISEFLEAAVKDKIENFEVKVHEGNAKGEGFMSEMMFVSLKNKKTNEDTNLLIKQVPPSEKDETRASLTSAFFTEALYYTEIFPAFLNLQKSYPDVRKFDNFPECYATCLEQGYEKLALENLKLKNYEMHRKQKPFDTQAFEKLFSLYGEFHALGFALKHHHPQGFLKIKERLGESLLLKDTDMTSGLLKYLCPLIKGNMEKAGVDKRLLDNFQKYIDDPLDIFLQCLSYKGSNGTILHGDCWSNNVMLKYDSSREIEDIKLLDFQIGWVATPVLDLSYSFYAGAAKESLDNLEHLLKLYHNVLSETLKKYGCNPDEIYPYEVLKKEWKDHCRFGFTAGLVLWMGKNAVDTKEMPSITEVLDSKVDVSEKPILGFKFDEEAYKKVTFNLVKHMHENGFL